MLLRKVFLLSVGSVVNTFITGIFSIYVTRVLGPEDKGVLTIAISTCGLMSMLFSFGVPYAAAYYIRSHPGSRSFVLVQTNRTMIVCGLLSFILVFFGRDLFSSVFLGGKAIDAFMVMVLVGMVIVNSANSIVGASLVAQGDSRGFALSLNMGTLITIMSTLILLWYCESRLHAVLSGTLLGAVCSTLMMRKQYMNYSSEAGERSHAVGARDFFMYGIQAQSGALASLFFKRIDLFIISYFINTSAVGFYSVGIGLRDLAMTASSSFAGLAGGEMADPDNQSGKKAGKILKKGIRFNILCSLVFFLGAVILFPYFIPFAYGEAFQRSINISVIIMGSLLPLSISLLIGKAIQARGKPLLQSLSSVMGAVVCTAVVWQLTKSFGVKGAAAATIIDSVVLLLLGFLFLRISNGKDSGDKKNSEVGAQ